jgi:hypothetical protein
MRIADRELSALSSIDVLQWNQCVFNLVRRYPRNSPVLQVSVEVDTINAVIYQLVDKNLSAFSPSERWKVQNFCYSVVQLGRVHGGTTVTQPSLTLKASDVSWYIHALAPVHDGLTEIRDTTIRVLWTR